jgi:hypothetical protein
MVLNSPKATPYLLFVLTVTCVARAQNLEVKAPSDLSSRNRQAVEVTRDKVRTDRRDLVAKSMELTDDEAQVFWPIYDQYAGELYKLSDRTVTLITQFANNYRDLADRDAIRMTTESLGIEQQKLSIRQRYVQQLTIVLPGRKVARFVQVERRLDAVTVLNVTQAISLVE